MHRATRQPPPVSQTSTDLPRSKCADGKSINETLLSVLYFSTYDCVYTDLVLSGCVVIFKIFTEVYCMILVFFVFYSCTAVNMCD